MKVLILTEHYLPLLAGTTTHVEYLSRALAKRGLDIILVVPDQMNGGDVLQEENSFDRRLIKVPTKLIHPVASDREARAHYISVCDKTIPAWLSDIQPDLIHVMYGHYCHKIFDSVCKIPKVWTCHNVPPQEYAMPGNEEKKIGRLMNRLYSSAIRFKHRQMILSYPYEKIIAISNATAQILNSEIGLAKKKIIVIPNGVRDIKKFSSSGNIANRDKPILLLTVGGLKAHKGIHHLPQVAHNLVDAGVNFVWRIVGQTFNQKYLEQIKKEIVILGLSDRIVWMGELAQSQLDAQYLATHLYVHMASQEGFCLTVLEALAMGIPVVGTRVGAIPEMIRHDRGVLVEPNAESITAGVKKAIKNYNFFKKGSELGKEVQAQYCWDIVAAKTEALYESCLRGIPLTINRSGKK